MKYIFNLKSSINPLLFCLQLNREFVLIILIAKRARARNRLKIKSTNSRNQRYLSLTRSTSLMLRFFDGFCSKKYREIRRRSVGKLCHIYLNLDMSTLKSLMMSILCQIYAKRPLGIRTNY